jgi:two-component system sensor histidine kinase UhpB
VANALVVSVGAALGTWTVLQVARSGAGPSVGLLVALLAAGGLVASVAVNALLLRWALAPLEKLEDAAARAREVAEPAEARIPVPPGAEDAVVRLVRAFNSMLETLSRYRRGLRRLAVRAQEAAEDERRRLASELQDDVAQRLASCLLQIQLARNASDDDRSEALEELRRQAGDTLETVRRMARGLRPPELDELGLDDALRALARETEEAGGPEVDLRIDPLGDCLRPESRLALYRSVQEALSNARRHAGATRVRLRLERRDDRVRVEVRDDGRGFDVDEVMADDVASVGITGIRERALYVGGEAVVASRPGAGTRIRIDVPCGDEVPVAPPSRRDGAGPGG